MDVRDSIVMLCAVWIYCIYFEMNYLLKSTFFNCTNIHYLIIREENMLELLNVVTLKINRMSPRGWWRKSGALRDISVACPLTQPPLKVAEVWFQVADEHRRLTGHGYDGRVFCVEGQQDVVWGCGHVYILKRTGEIKPPQPACNDEMTWPSGRTPQTSDPEGMMRWRGLGRKGNTGSLACKGGHRSKRFRRLWPRRGRPRLLASFRQSSWFFFRRGRPTARTCFAWLETQTSRLASVLARFI